MTFLSLSILFSCDACDWCGLFPFIFVPPFFPCTIPSFWITVGIPHPPYSETLPCLLKHVDKRQPFVVDRATNSVQEQLTPGDLDAICAFNYITKSATRDISGHPCWVLVSALRRAQANVQLSTFLQTVFYGIQPNSMFTFQLYWGLDRNYARMWRSDAI